MEVLYFCLFLIGYPNDNSPNRHVTSMTPAILIAKRQKTAYSLHEYSHDRTSPAYGMEASEKLGIAPERVFKTLVVKLDDLKLAVAIVPVAAMLNMKLFAKAAGAKKAAMADTTEAERATGYVVGGISPLGQKKLLPTLVDESALTFPTIFVSAGRRGLEIELAPQDLLRLTRGTAAVLCQ